MEMMKAEEALALANAYTDSHGGGGGTSDYSQLSNKPKINDVTLSGNKTSADLGLMPEYEVDTTPTESSENLITSGGVWSADKNINDKLQGSKTAGSTDGSPFEIPDYGMTESIQMYFKPTQDLHGYDKPWAGGAGKNKLPLVLSDIKALNTTGTWSGNTYTLNGVTFEVLTDSADNVEGIKVNGLASAWTTLNLDMYTFEVGNYIFSNSDDIPNGQYVTITDVGALSVNARTLNVSISESETHNIYIGIDAGTQTNNTIYHPMIRLSTETDADFEPYSNICPISGQNNATFEWTGKNKISGYKANTSINDSGQEVSNAGSCISNVIEAWFGDYTLSYTKDTGAVVAHCFDINDNYLGYFAIGVANPVTFAYNQLKNNTAHFILQWNKNNQGSVLPTNGQLEIGSTATAYEPYTHGEVSMNFGNTYYGGFCRFNGQIYPDWDYIASYNGETLSGEWVSDRDEYTAGTTPTIGAEVAYKTTPSYVRVTPPANLNLTDDYPIEYNGYMASISYQPKNTVLAEAKKYTNQEIAKLGLPQPPTIDGTYHLECSVSGGNPTITWVLNS